MLPPALARMIGPRARVGKEIEFAIKPDEAANFSPPVRRPQPEGEVAQTLVTRVAPRMRAAAER